MFVFIIKYDAQDLCTIQTSNIYLINEPICLII